MIENYCKFVYNQNKKDMKAIVSIKKSEAFSIEENNVTSYERIRFTMIHDDGSVVDNLLFWQSPSDLYRLIDQLAASIRNHWTAIIIELRETIHLHCSTANLLMSVNCSYEE